MTAPELLASRRASDPHSFLGAHPDGDGGVVVRAFRPDAKAVHVRTAAGRIAELSPTGTEGALRGRREGREAALRLRARGRVRARHVHGRRPVPLPADARRARPAPRRRGPPRGALRARSARTCASTRACAGRPSRCGRRARAPSPWSATSTPGTGACTRCARSARAASGSSSCPGVGPGARYKYEILTQAGEIRLKADPLAFATEVPPQTASVVFETSTSGTTRRGSSAAPPPSRSSPRSPSTRSTWARGG